MRKNKNKLFAFILALVFAWILMPDALAAGTVISVGFVSGAVGETVDVPVSISGNPGASALILWLGFDPDYLEPVAVTRSELIQSGMFVNNLASDRQPLTSVNVTWANTSDFTDDGLMYTISFRILRELPRDGTPLEWNVQNSNVSNDSLQLVDCVLQGGEVTPVSGAHYFPRLWYIALLPLLIIGMWILAKRKKEQKN